MNLHPDKLREDYTLENHGPKRWCFWKRLLQPLWRFEVPMLAFWGGSSSSHSWRLFCSLFWWVVQSLLLFLYFSFPFKEEVGQLSGELCPFQQPFSHSVKCLVGRKGKAKSFDVICDKLLTILWLGNIPHLAIFLPLFDSSRGACFTFSHPKPSCSTESNAIKDIVPPFSLQKKTATNITSKNQNPSAAAGSFQLKGTPCAWVKLVWMVRSKPMLSLEPAWASMDMWHLMGNMKPKAPGFVTLRRFLGIVPSA